VKLKSKLKQCEMTAETKVTLYEQNLDVVLFRIFLWSELKMYFCNLSNQILY